MFFFRRFKQILAAVLILFLLFSVGYCEGESRNLLQNGDFAELDSEGLPAHWYTDAYFLNSGYSVFGASEGDDVHRHIITIQNIAENDARFAQSVAVEPETLYRLSGYIRADGVDGIHGANLSIEGIYAFSDECFNTEDEWEYIEYYGETGPEQRSIVVLARLGGYSGVSTGKASFADLSLTKVDSVPGDLIADRWYRETSYDFDEEEDDEDSGPDVPFYAWLIVISVIYLYISLSLIHICHHQKNRIENTGKKITLSYLLPAMLAALALRLIIAYLVEGYQVDVGCFVSWGGTMAKEGPILFYEKTGFCDYPPLYTYVLGLNSLVSGWINAGSAANRIIFRFIPSLCDLAGCWIVYKLLVSQHTVGEQSCFLFLLVALFNPATVINSAAWGQMDSVLCLLLLAVSVFAVKGNWKAALPLYVIAVLVKPQALMLGPLGLIYILLTYIHNRETRKSIHRGVLFSFITLAAGIIPFSLQQNWDWLINLYSRTLQSYPYATLNTANFYYLLGGNWNSITNSAHTLAPVFLGLLSIGYSLWWYFRNENSANRLTETILCFVFASLFILCAFLKASWAWTGGLAMVFAFMIVLSPAIRSRDIRLLPWLGGLLYILLYVFGIKMHERYIFPALLLLAAAWAIFRDRRILYILLLLTVTTVINEGIVLDNSIRLGSGQGHLNSDTVWLADILSLLNITGALYAVWLSPKLSAAKPVQSENVTTADVSETDGSVQTLPDTAENEAETSASVKDHIYDRSLHWKRLDTICLSVITVIYSVVSLLTLGSTKAPQNAWTSSSPKEEIIFDLGEYRDDFEILYHAQVSKKNFSFSVSKDGLNWEDETWAQMAEGQCWKWKYVTASSYNDETDDIVFTPGPAISNVVHFSGRYVRLTAQQIGLTLNEILFRTEAGEILSVKVVGRTGEEPESVLFSDPAALTDEQDTLEQLPAFPGSKERLETPAQPSWWNSTYFDEIYHARTGFEFLHGQVPYETSHPPLGKVLISLSISVFGMTPFGWRFAGAFAGILMLPGMYLLGKQLTKKTGLAVTACLLMALDCQHLTQTQIATIDSFPVLFIIFAYFFMLRFMQTDFLHTKIESSLISLAFSGLFMGLSISSKWIGIYAGAGLAVLFFLHCFRVIRADTARDGSAYSKDIRRTLILCLWCILFFVIIPVLIYLLSYIPYFAYKAGKIHSLKDYILDVWNSQVGMFKYHSQSKLGMDHPFYSPWWEWPVIGKPMYYASHEYIPAGFTLRHSIFCFGNPAIWYCGLAALAYCVYRFAISRRYALEGTDYLWHFRSRNADHRFSFILIGLLAQYLPWVLVPRGTYIYHYFASIPFLMLAIIMCFDQDHPKYRRLVNTALVLYILAVAVFFVLLFPYACGLNVTTGWLDIGRRLLHVWYTN